MNRIQKKKTILIIMVTLLTVLMGLNIHLSLRIKSIHNRIQEINEELNTLEEPLQLPTDFFKR